VQVTQQQDPIWKHGVTKELGRHGMSNREYESNSKGQEIVSALRLALSQAEFEFASHVND